MGGGPSADADASRVRRSRSKEVPMTVTTDRRPAGVGPAPSDLPTAQARDLPTAQARDLPTASWVDRSDGSDRLLWGTRALLAAFVVFTALAAVSLLLLGGSTETTFA